MGHRGDVVGIAGEQQSKWSIRSGARRPRGVGPPEILASGEIDPRPLRVVSATVKWTEARELRARTLARRRR